MGFFIFLAILIGLGYYCLRPYFEYKKKLEEEKHG
jgi:hypothetical protein